MFVLNFPVCKVLGVIFGFFCEENFVIYIYKMKINNLWQVDLRWGNVPKQHTYVFFIVSYKISLHLCLDTYMHMHYTSVEGGG